MDIHPRSLLIARLSEEDLDNVSQFDCGDEEMNRFFRDECYEEQKMGLNSTYVLYYKGDLAAFCSVCADKISLSTDERDSMILPRNSVPALKIARLGRSVKYRGMGFGEYILEFVQYSAIQLAENDIGLRLLTLDAYPNREEYYKGLGFIRNGNQGRNSQTVSMRKDIYDSGETE